MMAIILVLRKNSMCFSGLDDRISGSGTVAFHRGRICPAVIPFGNRRRARQFHWQAKTEN